MHFIISVLLTAAVVVIAAPADLARDDVEPYHNAVPSLNVPACSTGSFGKVHANNTVPSDDTSTFPVTDVSLCYDDSFVHISFEAFEEKSFYSGNGSIPTNGNIYDYEVMEAFIYKGTDDPQTYLEFEVAPNNVTFNAFIYNPSKVRAPGAAFDRFYIADLYADQFTANTTISREDEHWCSEVQIPLGLFNIDEGEAEGTKWRMNFFRTVTSEYDWPNQTYGGWSAPNLINFHMTPFFGHVNFV